MPGGTVQIPSCLQSICTKPWAFLSDNAPVTEAAGPLFVGDLLGLREPAPGKNALGTRICTQRSVILLAYRASAA